MLYIDESGDPNGWQAQRTFVLAGVAIHEGQIYKLTQELEVVQQHYFPGITFPIAFHATDIRRGKRHFADFMPEQREQLLNDLYDIIRNARFPNLIAFATAIDISSVQNSLQVRRDTLQDICQRFNTFLIRQYKANRPSKGLLIIDRVREGSYRELLADFKKSGTEYGYLGNIVDIPYFARCHETRMLQLADLCAYAVFRYYEHNDSKYIDKIITRFDKRSPGHPPDGLKHITENECSCYACSWRR